MKFCSEENKPERLIEELIGYISEVSSNNDKSYINSILKKYGEDEIE